MANNPPWKLDMRRWAFGKVEGHEEADRGGVVSDGKA